MCMECVKYGCVLLCVVVCGFVWLCVFMYGVWGMGCVVVCSMKNTNIFSKVFLNFYL